MSGSDEGGEKSTTPKSGGRGASSRGGGGGPGQFHCSFCGKGQDVVQRLIAGPEGVYICDECVELCQEIVTEGQADAPEGPPWESHPHRTITELIQDERFVRMAAKRRLIFQVGIDKRIRVYQELDKRSYIFGVGPRGQSIVYRMIDDVELHELDQALSEEMDEERH